MWTDKTSGYINLKINNKKRKSAWGQKTQGHDAIQFVLAISTGKTKAFQAYKISRDFCKFM